MCAPQPSEPVAHQGAPNQRRIHMAPSSMVFNLAKAKRFFCAAHAHVGRASWSAALVCVLASPALGQSFPPPPPPRPAWLDAGRAIEPEPPAASAQPALPFAPPAPTKTMPPQPVLPPYDRAAMRACGLEWHELKQTGATQGRIWRDFAAECLPRRGAGR